jgi:hypothetical protein
MAIMNNGSMCNGLDFFKKFNGFKKQCETNQCRDDQKKCEHNFFISLYMPNDVPFTESSF